MIKNSSKIFALTLLLCSCTADRTGDYPLGESPGNAELSVRAFSANEAGAFAVNAGAPGETGSTPLGTSVDVGFYVQTLSAGDKTYYTVQNNVRGIYNTESTTWKPVAATPIWLNNHTASLAVYAPYDATQNNATGGVLDLKAALRTDDNDLAAGRFTANNQSMKSPGISVTLKRLYARVVFTFIKYTNYTAPATIDKIEWTGNDLYKAATYNLFADPVTDAYTISKTDGNRNLAFTFSPGLTIGTDKTVTDAARADLLLIPAKEDFTQDGTLTVTATTTSTEYGAETKVMSVPVPKSLFSGDRKPAAGKQLNITVRLSVADIIITNDDVVVTDWDETDAEMNVESKLD